MHKAILKTANFSSRLVILTSWRLPLALECCFETLPQQSEFQSCPSNFQLIAGVNQLEALILGVRLIHPALRSGGHPITFFSSPRKHRMVRRLADTELRGLGVLRGRGHTPP